MSKAKRVMQQNKRAAFVLGMSLDKYFATYFPQHFTLSQRGMKRILTWSKS